MLARKAVIRPILWQTLRSRPHDVASPPQALQHTPTKPQAEMTRGSLAVVTAEIDTVPA